MKMQKSDLDQVLDWITEHWSGDERQCPVCQHSNWNLGRTISELRSFHGGVFALVGPVLPVVSITCMNCGLVLQFNAIQLGIVKAPPSTPPSVESAATPPSKKEASDE